MITNDKPMITKGTTMLKLDHTSTIDTLFSLVYQGIQFKAEPRNIALLVQEATMQQDNSEVELELYNVYIQVRNGCNSTEAHQAKQVLEQYEFIIQG